MGCDERSILAPGRVDAFASLVQASTSEQAQTGSHELVARADSLPRVLAHVLAVMQVLCVAYIAAFPLPEVQRGINAFALGCKSRFSACVVKVAWVGTWHSVPVETAAARFFWNHERCELITQHSDTKEPQVVISSDQW